MANGSAAGAQPRAHYADATERTFRQALKALEKALPKHHTALVALLDDGRFDDLQAIVAVFEENAS